MHFVLPVLCRKDRDNFFFSIFLFCFECLQSTQNSEGAGQTSGYLGLGQQISDSGFIDFEESKLQGQQVISGRSEPAKPHEQVN